MSRLLRFPVACLALALIVACGVAPATAAALPAAAAVQGKLQAGRPEPAQAHPQETGFLNRRIELHGVTYRFQVYLPEEWRRDDRKQWPIILFLHGRGERGTEGMWQTQIGLPQAVRDHPDRWPFIIVMPQCPIPGYWTDSEMQALAMATLDQEAAEFHADPDRTYLVGLSLGGYGAWELARSDPDRWAAIVIAASGIFWSYAPERWQEVTTLPAEYARAVGHTPLWLFHGADDPLVPPRESEIMFQAVKAAGGHVRFWLYQGYKHDCWTRAFAEPEVPRWMLAHHNLPHPPATHPDQESPNTETASTSTPATQPYAERLVIPFHPAAIKLAPAILDTFVGDYRDVHGRPIVSVYRQGEQLFEKNQQGEVAELAAESPAVFFYLNGSATSRLTFEHDSKGTVVALLLRDDRHEERWEKHPSPTAH
jgi:acetyl esterase/lipase